MISRRSGTQYVAGAAILLGLAGVIDGAAVTLTPTVWVKVSPTVLDGAAIPLDATAKVTVSSTVIDGAADVLAPVGWYGNYVASPTDISTGDWTRTHATASDATTLLADNFNGIHYVHQAPAGVGAVPTVAYVAEVKAGTKTWCYVQNGSGGTGFAYVNLSTGAVGTSLGSVSVSDVGSGYWRIILTSTLVASADINLFTANANNAVSYSDDGTGSILVRFQGAYKVL